MKDLIKVEREYLLNLEEERKHLKTKLLDSYKMSNELILIEKMKNMILLRKLAHAQNLINQLQTLNLNNC